MDKSRYIFLFLLLLLTASAGAQTVQQAKNWFNEGYYDKAKPVFKRYAKAYPNNGSYNFWYGVCCLKTNEAQKAIQPLTIAVKRRVRSGQSNLAEAYTAVFDFEHAIENYEGYITDLEKKKRSTEAAEQRLAQIKRQYRMAQGVSRVTVIDSIVVDKSHFLDFYQLSNESGRIMDANTYFKKNDSICGTIYETQLANKRFFSQLDNDSIFNIYSQNKLIDKWDAAQILPRNINTEGNTNYPYMLSDGITLYYASDGPSSLGGYDIFVTRFNSSTNSYLNPENIGMPFNSTFNDYMLAVDEFNQIGWFASDRFQPSDKVCIYKFVPNDAQAVYDYETTDRDTLKSLALLNNISMTWQDKEEVEDALERLESLSANEIPEEKAHDFTCIINDNLTYHFLSDFKDAEAKRVFQLYLQKEKKYNELVKYLKETREKYTNMSDAEKAKQKNAILDAEKKMYKIENELYDLMIQVRQLELS